MTRFWLLAAVPAMAWLHWRGGPPVAVFGLALVAVFALVGFMGRATERLSAKLGPTVGGLFNASLNNLPELIIGSVALANGLTAVVKASLTGAILAVSRGAGEVAPIMFTGAAYFLPKLPTRLTDQFMELGYHVYVLSTQSPDIEATKPILYSTVLVLLFLTFLLNATAIAIRARFRAALRPQDA